MSATETHFAIGVLTLELHSWESSTTGEWASITTRFPETGSCLGTAVYKDAVHSLSQAAFRL